MLLFDLYRRLLMIICAVYGLVRLGQVVARWVDQLSGHTPRERVVRGYVTAMLVAVRLRRFRSQLLQIALLLAVLAGAVYAHRFVM